MDVDFNMLSPSKEEYGSAARTNETGRLLVATITYEVDVDTILTLDHGIVVLQGNPSYGGGMETAGTSTQAEVEAVFSIALYVNEKEDKADTSTAYSEMTLVAGTNDTLYVYAEVTGTSDTGSITGDLGDKRDTWIGGNITGVQYEISYKAVQNTQIPDAQK